MWTGGGAMATVPEARGGVGVLTCGRHGLVLSGGVLARLAHVDVVHGGALHRARGAERPGVAGRGPGLVHHAPRHVGGQGLHLGHTGGTYRQPYVCKATQCAYVHRQLYVCRTTPGDYVHLCIAILKNA
jgi:hypothetical protein